MLVLGRVSLELEEVLFGVLEVFPWTLGSNVDSAQRIAGPAVLAGVEEIVGVRIADLLRTVEALAIEPVLRLQSHRKGPVSQIRVQLEGEEEGEANAEDAVEGEGDVLLGHVPGQQEALQGLEEGATVHRLVKVEVVVARLWPENRRYN